MGEAARANGPGAPLPRGDAWMPARACYRARIGDIARAAGRRDFLVHVAGTVYHREGESVIVEDELQLYSIPDVAARSTVSDREVRRWIKDGRLPIVKVGRRVLIERAALEKFIAAHRVPNPA